MFDLNIVLVNYYSHKETLDALASLFADLKDSGLSAQVSVVDNSLNNDGIKNELEIKFPQVKYICAGENVGFGRGNTAGFKSAPARYYLALNPDTAISSGGQTIKKLVAFMDANAKVGAVGPKLVYPDGSLQYSCYRFDLPSILIKPLKQINWDRKYRWVEKYAARLLMKDFSHDETCPVDWILGAALLVRHEAATEVGWFDERYFMYFEDCDWCQRLWERGWPVYYLHDVAITHRYGRESAKMPGIIAALIKNKMSRAHAASWLKYLKKWWRHYRYY